MGIEIELTDFLNGFLKELPTKARDISLIQYYYGFGEDVWPTYEESATRYDLSSRERVRQILDSKFRNSVKPGDLPSALQCAREISSQPILRLDKISETVKELGLVQGPVNMGLINLLHDLGLCRNYEIYTPELQKTTRGTYFSSHNLFLINRGSLTSLKAGLNQAKKLPRSHGIARVSFLKNQLGKEFKYLDELIEILKSDADAWFMDSNGETYYLFETGDNTLINNMEKVRSISKKLGLDELTETLTNALNRRTAKDQFPSSEIIESYLRHSKYTAVVENAIELNLAASTLTKVEQAVVAILRESDSTDFSAISGELLSKGYGKPLIIKSVTTSPLVHVDKSAGRGHHTYSLVGKSVVEVSNTPENEKYMLCKQRLAEVSKNGTDREQLVYSRIEQPILTQWLFDGKSVEICAICGRQYSVTSLVTAHKKKRADCSANERIDPYIVMPLCLFGCDYLYEHGYLYISDGIVVENRTKTLTQHEESALKRLAGRRLDQRWLLGSQNYFRKPT
jgi:hypothetical protein